jgi:hypothetical protein
MKVQKVSKSPKISVLSIISKIGVQTEHTKKIGSPPINNSSAHYASTFC